MDKRQGGESMNYIKRFMNDNNIHEGVPVHVDGKAVSFIKQGTELYIMINDPRAANPYSIERINPTFISMLRSQTFRKRVNKDGIE